MPGLDDKRRTTTRGAAGARTANEPRVVKTNGRPAIRLGIIGDVHAEHEHLQEALRLFDHHGVDELLCTGDLADGPGCIERCIELLAEHNVLTVRGNHERWLLDDKVRHVAHAHHRAELSSDALAFLSALPKQIELSTCAGPLLLCHGVGDRDMVKVWPGSDRLEPQRSELLDQLIDAGHFRWLINGHMHYRTLLHFGGLTLMNAGTLSRRHRPGVTLIDFGSSQLTAFEFDGGGQLQPVLVRSTEAQDDDPRWDNTAAFCGDQSPVVLYPSTEPGTS